MKVEEWRILMVTSVVVLGSLTVLPFLREQVPPIEEGFFSIGILNDEELAQNYFPSGSIINRDITWNIYVSNQMKNPELLLIQVKLLNSSHISPNSTSCSPSQGVIVFEKRMLLATAEEALIPFIWNLNNVTESDVYAVNSIQINGIETKHIVVDTSGIYKLVFEVWNYNIEEKNFVFQWNINNRKACAWAQIIINLD